jgi:hypothetical protein
VATPTRDEQRTAALDAHVAYCVSRGFELETRTNTQAIIVRRRRFARVRGDDGLTRLVVWVDELGTVESRAIDARRW